MFDRKKRSCADTSAPDSKDSKTLSRLVRRYSAYFAGWCVAFGEHDIHYDENRETNWLFGDSKVGFTLSPQLKRLFFQELLGRHKSIPLISIEGSGIRLNEKYRIPVTLDEDRRGLAILKKFISTQEDVHLCLTSHFYYPQGTRIITFTTQKPLTIIYKEIQPMRVEISQDQKPNRRAKCRTGNAGRGLR